MRFKPTLGSIDPAIEQMTRRLDYGLHRGFLLEATRRRYSAIAPAH